MANYENLNKILRIMDEALGKSFCTQKVLMEKLEMNGFPVSERTFHNYLNRLRKKVEVSKRPGPPCAYRYTNLGESYFSEIDTRTRMALERFFALTDHIQGLEKIRELKKIKQEFRKLYGMEDVPSIISFPSAGLSVFNIENVERLYQAIVDETAVTFSYETYNKPATARLKQYVFHPYHLKIYNNRWYAIGYTKEHGDCTVFPTDRIRGAVTPAGETYIRKRRETDYDALFNDRVGISEGKKINLKIAVDEVRLRYLTSRKLHPSQEIVTGTTMKDGRRILSFPGIVENEELRQKLLSFGKEIEVIEPASLRRKMAERIKDMQEQYARPVETTGKA